MKISVITPTLNQVEFIEDTIQSVLNQDSPDFEHIVIDGGSTDGTLDILNNYDHLKWISEKDSGQSNAINKGFKMASGEILTWLNSDDFFEANIFQYVINEFETKKCFFLYGNINYIKENKKMIGTRIGGKLSIKALEYNPDMVAQPGSFWLSDVVQRVGYLDETLHLALDYEYFLRIGKYYSFHHINKTLCNFRCYPSGKTFKLRNRQSKEIYSVMKRYFRFPRIHYLLFKANRIINHLKFYLVNFLRLLKMVK